MMVVECHSEVWTAKPHSTPGILAAISRLNWMPGSRSNGRKELLNASKVAPLLTCLF